MGNVYLPNDDCNYILIDIWDKDGLQGFDADPTSHLVTPGVARFDLASGVATKLRLQSEFTKEQLRRADRLHFAVISGEVYVNECLSVAPIQAGCKYIVGDEGIVQPTYSIKHFVMQASGGPAVVTVALYEARTKECREIE